MNAHPRDPRKRSARRLAFGLGLSLLAGVWSPSPGIAQTYAIRGGTVHTLDGDPFVGTVLIRAGRVIAVGPEVRVPEGAEVVDATGRHVYPGMFDAITQLGLTEVGQVAVTNDAREQGFFDPQLRAATAVHPATEHIPVARANGITHAMAVPQGPAGGIPGQASLLDLDGWTVEEMEIDPGAAMVVNFPTLQTREFDRATFSFRERSYREARAEYEKKLARLDRWLEAARQYRKAGDAVPRDLALEALARVVAGEQRVLLMANGERTIRNAVAWAERQQLDFVLGGGKEAWKVADLLAEKHVPVILSPTQSMPSSADAPYDEAYANPGKLYAAGVKIAFATFGSANSRTLPYEAAMAVPFGLPHDAALAAVTRNAAEMLGFGSQLGTISPGKTANLIVTDGDPLEIRTHVLELFVRGRPVSTDNKQRRLYEKYRARPRKGLRR